LCHLELVQVGDGRGDLFSDGSRREWRGKSFEFPSGSLPRTPTREKTGVVGELLSQRSPIVQNYPHPAGHFRREAA
jgi:hypothetical protein